MTGIPLAPGIFESVSRVVQVVDELRDAGLQQYVTLPRIAVVGTQSGGKSSLLESIVGADFLPRGDGVVTRRPLELRLVRTEGATETFSVFANSPNEKYHSFPMVRDEIIRLTETIAGKNKGIVDDPIVLTVYSPSCPDLTLIDLPGITRVPVKNSDQRDDIERVTKEMAMRYITDPRTIILAVVPANQDMSTSDALQMARQVDPQGVRTIGVVTKLDIMDPGTDACKMLLGDEVGLRLGFVGVKMRGQAEIKADLGVREALENERRWFAEHPKYSRLPSGHTGTDTLIAKLTGILFRHIKAFLPFIKKEVAERRTKTKERLAQLGDGVPEGLAEQVQLIWGLITDYCEVLKNGIKGKFDRRLQSYSTGNAVGSNPASLGLFSGMFTGNSSAPINQQQLSSGAQIRAIFNSFLADLDSQPITSTMTDEDIDFAIKMHEGDSLPGFPSPDIFEFLVLPHLKKIREPSSDCVQAIAGTLENVSLKVGSNVFKRFPKLGEAVAELTAGIISRERDKALSVIENIVDLETGYLFTNDGGYLSAHGNMQKLTSQPGAPATGTPGSVAPPQVPTAVLGSQPPRVSRTPYISEIRARLDSYFSLVVRAVRDSIPKAVGFFLVRQVQEKLQFELYTALNKTEVLAELLGEPETVRAERRGLQKQLAVLDNSLMVLQKDPGIAAIQGVEGVVPDQSMPQSAQPSSTVKIPSAASFAPPKPKASLFDELPSVKRPANPLFD